MYRMCVTIDNIYSVYYLWCNYTITYDVSVNSLTCYVIAHSHTTVPVSNISQYMYQYISILYMYMCIKAVQTKLKFYVLCYAYTNLHVYNTCVYMYMCSAIYVYTCIYHVQCTMSERGCGNYKYGDMLMCLCVPSSKWFVVCRYGS